MKGTNKLIEAIKENDCDYEFYPSTPQMLAVIKSDIKSSLKAVNYPSVLDCGAGDGRVLNALTEGKKYAIEKALPLINSLDKDVFIVGTEFNSQSLMDKKVDIITSNPPYTEFEQWAVKIISEANAKLCYLIIPTRWSKSEDINAAIEARDAEVTILGEFDFLSADRVARAVVNVVKVNFQYNSAYNGSYHNLKTDPFKIWFQDNFKIEISKREKTSHQQKMDAEKKLNEKISTELVEDKDIVAMLEQFYQRDLDRLLSTYQGLTAVDPEILKELNVNIESVQNSLELKVAGLKDIYWKKLFSKISSVTDRLTASSRSKLLDTLTEHTHVDFTVGNAHAILGWVVKNANDYFDAQLVKTMEKMTKKANVIQYKSNQKTYRDDDWRYSSKPKDLDCYSLDYRVILEGCGGLSSGYESVNGLSKRAAEFIGDICAIATNVSFDTSGTQRAKDFEWKRNTKNTFQYRDVHTGELHTLFEVRAFLNGNLHFTFNQKFICSLNVEFGRLKGWLKTAKEASQELDIDLHDATSSFRSNVKLIGTTGLLQLSFDVAA